MSNNSMSATGYPKRQRPYYPELISKINLLLALLRRARIEGSLSDDLMDEIDNVLDRYKKE